MYVTIDFNSDEAFYIQLKKQIIMGIAMAEIREGDSLPSVRDMADDIGINMHTVNKAYALLRQEGYVKVDRRRGAVIAVSADRAAALEDLKEHLRIALARSRCKNIPCEEVHRLIDEIYGEYDKEQS